MIKRDRRGLCGCHAALAAAGAAVLVSALGLAGCGARSSAAEVDAGKAAAAQRDHGAAVIHFKGALQDQPGNAEIRVLLGLALLATEDPAGAAVEFAKALDQGADADRVTPLLAQALLRANEAKRVVNQFAATTLGQPAAQSALKAAVAGAWEQLGDGPKAKAALDAALAAAPEVPQTMVLHSRMLAQQGQTDAALVLLDRLIERQQMAAEAWVLKADLLAVKQAGPAVIEAAYRQALAIDSGNVAANFALVNALVRKPDLAAARQQAEAFKRALPKHSLNVFIDAQLAFAEGDYVRARDLAQKMMQQAPGNVGVLQMAGTVAAHSREWVQAETFFTKALQIEPTLASSRRGLAQVYIALGQPSKSLAVLKPLLDGSIADGSGQETLALAGDAQLVLGDSAAAEAYFNRAIQIQPEDLRVKTALALSRLSRGEVNTAFTDLSSAARGSTAITAELAAYSARLRRREYDAALAVVEQIATKQPKNTEVDGMRGRVYLARRDLVQARSAFEAQAKADPSLAGAVTNLAAIDLLEKKPEAARKRLQAQIKADPKNVYARLALAQLQETTGAPLEEVKQLIRDAVAAAPQTPEPRLQLIALTLRKRLYKEALVAAQEASAAMPGDLTVMDAVGRAQMEAGDVEQAISTFRKLASAEGKAALAYSRLADIYKASGKRDAAEVALRKALEAEPGLLQAQGSLIELMFAGNRKPEALAMIRRMQQSQPLQAAGYAFEASYHLKLKAPDAAVAAYRTGLAKTASTELAQGLLRLLYSEGRRDEGDRHAAAWLKDHPDDAAVDYQVAESEIGRGQYDRAQARLQRLQSGHPDHVLVLNNLAFVLLMRGQTGALPYAQKAHDLAPDNAWVMDTLAAALLADQQPERALALQRRAVETQPDAAVLRLRLATLALQTGDKATARSEVDKLQALGEKFKRQDEVARLRKLL